MTSSIKTPPLEFTLQTAIRLNESIEEGSGFDLPLRVNGVAINECVSLNGVTYTANELRSATPTLFDVPILKDHEANVDNVIGRTTGSEFAEEDKSVLYEGKIMDRATAEKIADGRIKTVSIGAFAKELVRENPKDPKSPLIAKGIVFKELSVVPVPGVVAASLQHAFIRETFRGGISVTEEEKTDDGATEDPGKGEDSEGSEKTGAEEKTSSEDEAGSEDKSEDASEGESEGEAATEESGSTCKECGHALTEQQVVSKELKALREEIVALKKKPVKETAPQGKGKPRLAQAAKKDDNMVIERGKDGMSIYVKEEFVPLRYSTWDKDFKG